jgi:hypothetical protein
MKIFKFILTTVVFSTLFSCENNDFYDVPDLSTECQTLTVNKAVTDVTNAATTTAQKYTGNDIIEAYVTSSDAGGNFYKSISFVSVDNNTGFSMPVDEYNLYTKFEPGRKVYIKLKDRYFDKENGSTVIGSSFNSGVGRISAVEYQNVIVRSCQAVNEDDLVKHITITQALNDSYLNKLIEFDAVQFTDLSLGKTYFDASVNNLGGATNHTITDLYGNTIILRISQYAGFATESVPSGNGKIRGVLTKFGSTYQFMVRTVNDIKLINSRQAIDMAPPKGGASVTTPYPSTINENFEAYTVSTTGYIFPNYVNDPSVGTRYWDVKTFSSNKYAQMTAFGATGAVKTYLIIPVNFTPGYKFSFKTKDGYNTGNGLKVYYSTNYILGGIITNATLTDITSNFTIASGTATGYAANFTNSGLYTIPNTLTGQGYLIFEYSGNGSGGVTTTYQIDDIVVTP